MPIDLWARSFQIEREDIEFLTSLLLEKEQPLSTEQLAHLLVEHRLVQEAAELQERFKDTRFYNPAESYDIGQKVVFPVLDFNTGTVVSTRDGINPEHEPFKVIGVEFEDGDQPSAVREFASDLATPHTLSQTNGDSVVQELGADILTTDEIMESLGDRIIDELEVGLHNSGTLIQVARQWFVEDLLTEVNVGHINLVEAVLDINSGGPMDTRSLLENIGGLGDGPIELQEFSLNYVLKDDNRFDEVGSTGQVLWYLTRLEPAEVQRTPALLQYTPIEFDRSLLDDELIELELEINDELSANTKPLTGPVDEATVTLIYPHRRTGTLPLTPGLRRLFPTAERTPRVFVTLVDAQDEEEYAAWVVREERYVFGLGKFYRKHQLPVGAFVTARQSDEPGKIIIDFNAYRPRTEWIRLIVPRNNQIAFEEVKRSIGADYDDLMTLGADDLDELDSLVETTRDQRKTLVAIITSIITALTPLSPQGTVHAKTIYSAVNVIRRCPPGPILATLVANPDFENVGGHYWRLSGN